MLNILFLIMILYSSSFKLDSKFTLSKNSDKLPNTDYLNRGYNIFFGDLTPRNGDVDPGFRSPIFDNSFSQNRKTSDHRYEIPDGFNLIKVEGCSLTMSSKIITGEESFQNTFGLELGIGGNIKGISFSASTSFQLINEETKENKNAYVYSKADCNVYKGEIDAYDPPLFSRSFIRALELFNTRKVSFNDNPNLYWTFIRNFG